jgi:protein-arginine kinase activator protein McsA
MKTSLPPILPTAQCTTCGLVYREFCEYGLLGCEQCYQTFSSAIRAALAILQKDAPCA